MTENKFYKPVGGLVRAELFHTSQIESIDQLKWGAGVEVALVDDASSYVERFSADNRQVSVLHTLTLCSDRNLAQQWFDGEFLRQVAADGVVALVELATGEQLTVGWCRRMAFEQALRLNSLEFDSGQGLNDSPRVKMVLCCRDVTSAFNIE
ncbi:MAG: hypothetical protein IJB87_02605 [Alistipes sp.]|nr:hypothetical protein [Alistipes sp.]MBQ4127945.1 hypothetical protein [Alistipes sp.]